MILDSLETCYRVDYKIIENKEFIFTWNSQTSFASIELKRDRRGKPKLPIQEH